MAEVVTNVLSSYIYDATTANSILLATPTNQQYTAPIPTNIDTFNNDYEIPALNGYSPTIR
jgi:hypothetical protein